MPFIEFFDNHPFARLARQIIVAPEGDSSCITSGHPRHRYFFNLFVTNLFMIWHSYWQHTYTQLAKLKTINI
jgi:hypothetical protein